MQDPATLVRQYYDGIQESTGTVEDFARQFDEGCDGTPDPDVAAEIRALRPGEHTEIYGGAAGTIVLHRIQ